MEKKLESQSNIATDTHLTCLDLLCLFFTDVCLHQKCFLWLFSLSSFPFDPLSVFAVFRFLSCCFFIHWFTDFLLSLSLSLFSFTFSLSLSHTYTSLALTIIDSVDTNSTSKMENWAKWSISCYWWSGYIWLCSIRTSTSSDPMENFLDRFVICLLCI